jgi:hypothetical protein
MQINSVTQLASAFSPVAIALLTGYFAARSSRQKRSDRVLSRLSSELAVVGNIPDGAPAKSVLEAQLHATAVKYQEVCTREDTLRREPVALSLGALFAVAGVWLGTWAALKGGVYMWWWSLAFPLLIFGVVGFFYELGGGQSAQTQTPSTPSAIPPMPPT